MAVTRTLAAAPEQFFQQIDNIIKSHSLRGSESLCKLLQYLAKQALDHPHSPLKEYQIATEVFGRPADFDPQSDSTVRVQASRLRAQLAGYYAGGRVRALPSWQKSGKKVIPWFSSRDWSSRLHSPRHYLRPSLCPAAL